MRTQRLLNAVRHPITEWKVTRAKSKHRKQYPLCTVCKIKRNLTSTRGNDVHHMLPVHVRPDLACDAMNLITLCRTHHFWLGHCNNWRKYNGNLTVTINRIKTQFHEHAQAESK